MGVLISSSQGHALLASSPRRIWSTATSECLHTLQGPHEQGVLGLALSRDGRTLASAWMDRSIR